MDSPTRNLGLVMLANFVCPDGAEVAVLECLGRCRMARRCLSLPTLREVAAERRGAPSVTQLLNGTMMEFLRLTRDFTIEPSSRAFALLGTRHHARLAGSAYGDDAIAEELFEGDTFRGHPDYLEQHEDGTWTLWDYKTWGSYRVARFLGLVKEKVNDPTGAIYRKSGTWGKKGEPKQIDLWTPNPLMADTREVDLQFNAYRLLAEAHGLTIRDMRLQVTVRDAGLAVATERGILKPILVLDVARLPDQAVTDYFSAKRHDLDQALREGAWSVPCTPDERWDDTRCRGYCEVADFCPHGREVKHGTE